MKRQKIKIENFCYTLGLSLLSLLFAFPIIWTLTMSFKTRDDIFAPVQKLFPSQWTLDNYREVLSTGGVLKFFENSFFVSSFTTLIVVILAVTCGYGIQRLSRKNNERISNTVLLLRMIPSMVLTIPYFLIFKQFKLIDSLPGVAMCYVAMGLPLGIWLCRGFYKGIPDSLYEAAVLDGANEYQIFWHVSLPLIKNSIVVIVLQSFFAAWNELTLAMILINKTENRTMAVGIKYWASNTLETPYARMAAAGMLCIVPTLIVTIVMQKYLIQGYISGAVKG